LIVGGTPGRPRYDNPTHRQPEPSMPIPNSANLVTRRRLLLASGVLATIGLSGVASVQERRFDAQPGAWRMFDVTTQVEIKKANGATCVWLPIPSIDSTFQKSLKSTCSGNASLAHVVADSKYGAKMPYAEFDPATKSPQLVLTSRVQTRNRATDWERTVEAGEDAATLKSWTPPIDLMPTDGIVLDVARRATRGAWSDEAKVRQIYDWVISHTYREPAVRGGGVGDIKTMLETGNFGGKCADINGLFVGLCRAVGIPARDVYGVRVAPSAFGYRELGGDPGRLQGAQHCRAEVWLRQRGWVTMDPADVAKVMRQETPEWIKDERNPLVVPVRKALYGGSEGNWRAFNNAHDVVLPGAHGARLGFLMYPQAENANGRYDALDADNFKYTITAREITG
jgi:transglutaminase-like putative cysteine protease